MNSPVISLPSLLPEYICSGSRIIFEKKALDKLEALALGLFIDMKMTLVESFQVMRF